MGNVIKEIEKRTPVGTRLGIRDDQYEVTGHQHPSSDRIQIDLCTPVGRETRIRFDEGAVVIKGNTIQGEGTLPVEILGTRD